MIEVGKGYRSEALYFISIYNKERNLGKVDSRNISQTSGSQIIED